MKEPRIYGSRWDKARLSFLKSHPLCVMCHRQGRAVPATVVDHIRPHRLKEALNGGGQEAVAKAQKLFWDIRLGLLMLVSHWYENRSSVSELEKSETPMAFEFLLQPRRLPVSGF